MSLIHEYRETETAIKELQDRLQALAGDDRLKREIEFEEKLRNLMAEYDKNLRHIIQILDPQRDKKTPAAAPKQRRERTPKTFKNPHTGEQIQTKGGNHKILKAWKAEFGNDEVESWLQ